MARVFITGSSDGLGLMAARLLIDQGHEVVLHGRNEGRSRDALAAAPGARGVVSGDLATIAGARTVADEVNKLGRFDAVIHNAGVGYREGRVETEPGVRTVFAVNVLAVFPRSQRLCHRIDRQHRQARRNHGSGDLEAVPGAGALAGNEEALTAPLRIAAVGGIRRTRCATARSRASSAKTTSACFD